MEQEIKNREKAHCKPFLIHDSFVEGGRRIKMAAEIGLAKSGGGSHWSRALRRRRFHRKSKAGINCCSSKKDCMGPTKAAAAEDLATACDGDGDEVVEIERRVRALQMLVPGGEDMEVDKLFEETADYIKALRGQVSVMRALAGFLDGVARERRMMGG